MTEEPYNRQDALDLFTRVSDAEAFQLLSQAVGRAIAESDEAGQPNPNRQPLLSQAETFLEEALRIYERLPDKSVPYPEVERRARGLLQAFRLAVAYWLDLRS